MLIFYTVKDILKVFKFSLFNHYVTSYKLFIYILSLKKLVNMLYIISKIFYL